MTRLFEVSKSPVTLADVMNGGRLVATLLVCRKLAGEALKLRQRFFGPFFAIQRNRRFQDRVEGCGLFHALTAERSKACQENEEPGTVHRRSGPIRDAEGNVARANRTQVGRVGVHTDEVFPTGFQFDVACRTPLRSSDAVLAHELTCIGDDSDDVIASCQEPRSTV